MRLLSFPSFFLSSPKTKKTEPILTRDGSCDSVARKEVPFGGFGDVDNDRYCLWVETPKTEILGAVNRHFKPNFINLRMTISF